MLKSKDKDKCILAILNAAYDAGMYNKWEFYVKNSRGWSNNCSGVWIYDGPKGLKTRPVPAISCYGYLMRNSTFDFQAKGEAAYLFGERIPNGYIGGYLIINPGFKTNTLDKTKPTEAGVLEKLNKKGEVHIPPPVQRKFIKELTSEKSLYWNGIMKHNPPRTVNFRGEKVTINTPEFIFNHGFIMYNPEETQMPVLVTFLCNLRDMAEHPACVRNYFHLRLNGVPIKEAILFSQYEGNIKKNKSFPRLGMHGHSTLSIDNIPGYIIEQLIDDGITCLNYPSIIEEPNYTGWTSNITADRKKPENYTHNIGKNVQLIAFKALPFEEQKKYAKIYPLISDGFSPRYGDPIETKEEYDTYIKKGKSPHIVFTDYSKFIVDFCKNEWYRQGAKDNDKSVHATS